MAEVLSKSNQKVVVDQPVPSRQDLAQSHFRFLGVLCLDVAPTVADAMHVGIHADSRLAEGQCDDEIRRFAPHSR